MSSKLRTVFETPWFTVAERTLGDGQPYYMLELPDYVSVVAVTREQRMLVVRQYRPVVDRVTIELPSGHVDSGESPDAAARRELLEETGFVVGQLDLLGTLVPDVGRLANRMWCYFGTDARPSDCPRQAEAGLSVIEMPVHEVLQQATDGTMDHALNLAPLFLAVALGKLSLDGPFEAPIKR